MDKVLNQIGNNDNVIHSIQIGIQEVKCEILLWNGEMMRLVFKNCMAFKEKQSVKCEIGNIEISFESPMLYEVKRDILEGGGSERECEGLKSYLFYDAYNEVVIMEIIAENVA